MQATIPWQDRLVVAVDQALRTLAAPLSPTRISPAESVPNDELGAADRARSSALLRVNHAGEMAAQALYSGQALVARSESTRRHLNAAAEEEHDHLAWCASRLQDLGGRKSLLDPLWYAGSFCIGALAGSCGDRFSLGFVTETERQVEAHLHDHLQRLPEGDRKSHAILSRMAADEAHHGTTAKLAGGTELPRPVRACMAFGGEILRRVALYV